ncbi:transmembrane protein 145-like [Euwallacea similis]|uniref:transmembrane protein 145-like n=1 Tax=Euwallacea similis TaxID=1736056 RepID=UPI00344B5701
MSSLFVFIGLLVNLLNYLCSCKYVEGELKTRENWAFLARFCFLSEEGQFEYVIDYNENQGDINLLLYYDTEGQWPAVYKSNKSCKEREAVLNIQQNQIVNLTARIPAAREFAGCKFRTQTYTTTPAPLYTLYIPAPKGKTNLHKGTVTIKMPSTTAKTSTRAEVVSPASESRSTLRPMSTSSNTVIDYEGTPSSTSPLQYSTYYSDWTEHTTILDATTESMTEDPLAMSYKAAPIRKRSVPMKPVTRNSDRYGRFLNCHNARRFKSSRERWWFIAVSNCNETKGIDINYQLLMTNGPPGDYWHEHFSADEFYILPILMAFSIAYSILMLATTVCSLELKQRQLLHTTYKIYMMSCILQLLGILLMCIVYLKMAVSGRESPRFKRFANMLLSASETCFLLLLLLLAKGFTITRGRLPLKGAVKLTVFMCLYIMTYMTIFVYEAMVFDPGEVLYLYESAPGYALIMLRLCAWGMFVYSTVFTLKRYPEKSNFYYPFNLFGTVWFVAGPAFIISANNYIDKWVRESVVYAVLLFIAFGGHLMFLILTTPSVANKNFPYHVRTTQIGIMEVNGNAGTSTIEQFGHHAYEPSFGIGEHTVIIPLTRRTEEIFEGMYNQKRFAKPQITELPDDSEGNGRISPKDPVLDNVLKWSMVKNIPALDFPDFDSLKTKRDSIGSATSKLTDASFQNGLNTRRPSLNNHLNQENQSVPVSYEDFVGRVPIELFTISRVVETGEIDEAVIRKNV